MSSRRRDVAGPRDRRQQSYAIRDAGFGREVRSALDARRQWLLDEQLADADNGVVRLRANAIMMLQRRDLVAAGNQLEGQLTKSFVEAQSGTVIEGRLTRRVELSSGSFAVVEKSQEFTLVPWRPVLERQMGNAVSGLVRGDGVSWRIGQNRSGPQIT